MLNPPLMDDAYPVTALMEAFGVQVIASVAATPVAVVATTVAHAPEDIALVPSAEVPLAIVCVEVDGRSACAIVTQAGAAETDPVPIWTRKFLVAVVFPASLAATGVAFS
jgi:hypothetical protein